MKNRFKKAVIAGSIGLASIGALSVSNVPVEAASSCTTTGSGTSRATATCTGVTSFKLNGTCAIPKVGYSLKSSPWTNSGGTATITCLGGKLSGLNITII